MDKCIFCKISQGEVEGKNIIYENSKFFSIPDIEPVNKGHSIVISKEHFKTILDLPNVLGPALLDCIKNTALKLLKETGYDGFNVVNNNFESAQQVVNHVHFHIHPRKGDDGKSLEMLDK